MPRHALHAALTKPLSSIARNAYRNLLVRKYAKYGIYNVEPIVKCTVFISERSKNIKLINYFMGFIINKNVSLNEKLNKPSQIRWIQGLL